MRHSRLIALIAVLILAVATASAGSLPEQAPSTELNSVFRFAQVFPGPSHQENPVSAETQLADIVQRANVAAQTGNCTGALPLYQEALRIASPAYMAMPGNEAALHRAIGACYYRLGRLQEAIPEITKANALRETAENYALLGDICNSLADVPMAERNFQKAVELEPGNADYCALLAEASCHLGNFEIAQRAIDLGSRNAARDETRQNLHRFQLSVLIGTGRYKEASRLYSGQKSIGVDFKSTTEPRIAFVAKGGPAQLAGLQSGDLILSFNGEPIPNLSTLRSAVERAEFGTAVPVRIDRNGIIRKRKVIVGILPNLPELSAAANRPQVSKGAQPQPAAAASSLIINRVVVSPATVPAGGQFTIEVFYTTTSKGTVKFTSSIHASGEKLFESPPQAFEVNSAEPQVFTSKISAGDQPGKYTIRVRLLFGDSKAEREATLTVTAKKQVGRKP
jgi:Flp pilus assembly protein TadD